MIWKKLGQIYSMDPINDDLLSHASNPLPVYLYDNVFRVFFSGRDVLNRSSVGSVDIDVIKQTVIGVNPDTHFKYGKPDSFYSHGVSIGNMYQQEGHQYILFMGWNIPENQHWRGDIGRLELSNNSKINLDPVNPYMTTDEHDPVSLSYPYVILHEGIYKMWYGSTVDWKTENGEMLHVIKYATSKNGIQWTKHGLCIPYELGIAQAFSRPSVLIDKNGYHMWYSYRSGTGTLYRIGYSYSSDGINWIRKHDEVGIDVSEDGWDSEMICYPFVFDHKGSRYMLYNGNQFGKQGFGLAILQQ